MRSSAKAKTVVTDEALNIKNKTVRRKYQPKDMAEHLFPPEDVAKFREKRQAADGSEGLEKKECHVC